MKKIVLVFLLLLLITPIALVYGKPNIKIEKETIRNTIISELDEPAVFNLEIENFDEEDYFEVYTLVSGVTISPSGTFNIKKGETKKVQVKVYLSDKLKEDTGDFSFVYKIRSQKSGILDDILNIQSISLSSALEIGAENIYYESEQATVYIKNKYNTRFPQLDIHFSSAFFDFTEKVELEAYEQKEFKVILDQDKIKQLVAGNYILTAKAKINNIEKQLEGTLRYIEKPEINIEEESSGLFVSKKTITKTNEGNMPNVAEIQTEKNIISRLFTSFNIEPTTSEIKSLKIIYTWQEELRPAEELKVSITTNWFYPIILIILIFFISWFAFTYFTSNLILNKKLQFVKTKSGNFALKIIINVKARKFIEKINILDKLPPVVKLYNRFGALEPTKIDERNRRLEWNIDSMQEGEERILSYIIYSKIGIVGKFRLPQTTAIYESDGKIKEISSNKLYFVHSEKSKTN